MSTRKTLRVIRSSEAITRDGEVRNVPGNSFNKHESRNPIVSFLMQRFHSGLIAAIEPSKPASILDVGCGEGRTTRVLSASVPATVVGVDLEEVVLRQAAKAIPGTSFLVGSALDLPFADRSFDVVVATEVLEHLDQPETALQEMARVARRSVVVTVPHEPWWRIANISRARYLTALGNTPGHVQHWTPGSLSRTLGTQGESVRVTLAGLWLLGVIDL